MDKRDYISVRDARPEAIEALLDIAEEMRSEVKARPRRASTLLQGHVMASLFLEPSTRTRMSFDTAIQRLGGGLISLADAEASSRTQG